MFMCANPDGHPWIYAADLWCHACGATIRQDITKEGKAPADPDDEHSYDSGEFPKYCSEMDESDSPNHCGANEECLSAIELSDGTKIGALVTESLTTDGEEYVKTAVKKAHESGDTGSVAVEVWQEVFDWIDYELPDDDDDDE